MAHAANAIIPAQIFKQPGFQLQLPKPQLASWVQCLWSVQASGLLARPVPEKSYPDGGVSLTIEFLASGPVIWLVLNTRTNHEIITGEHDLLGVRFQPGGAGGLLGLVLPSISPVPMRLGEDLTPSWLVQLETVALQMYGLPPVQRFAVLQRWLQKLPAASGLDHPRVAGLVQTAQTSLLPVAALAAELGLTKRTLERRFQHYVGVSPALFTRFARLKQARQLLQNKQGSIADIALQCGYYDQAHFSHAFKSVAQESPADYRARKQHL